MRLWAAYGCDADTLLASFRDRANQQPMDSSGLMVKQAETLRALNPHSKFFVYRNLVKASTYHKSTAKSYRSGTLQSRTAFMYLNPLAGGL